MIEDISINVRPEISDDSDKILSLIAVKKGIKKEKINDFRIIRRSIDARKKDIKVNLMVRIATDDNDIVNPDYEKKIYNKIRENAPVIIIVGAGPAGLFAALKAIEKGVKPIVIERGDDVDNRLVRISEISRKGIIDPDSNYCFGEGGAGTYSDGKLFTRSKKRGDIREILNILHQFGASEDILIDAHPHIGSDKLPKIIKNIREEIIRKGGEVRFREKLTDFIIDADQLKGIKTDKGNLYHGPVILATGHSARDVYRLLKEKKIKLEAKGLAIGMRIEHPQYLIDCIQYHSKNGRVHYLPAASYNLVTQVNGRGVYTFCMCPGGVIVPAMNQEGQMVVNGMSTSSRSGKWANSGFVVELHPGDIPGYEENHELEMMALQEDLEHKMNALNPGSFQAPAQRIEDFIDGIKSATLPKSSYAPGIYSARLDRILPAEISERIKEGLKKFDKTCKGYLTNEAIFVGLESRTSSPVRIPRDKDKLSHVEFKNLYPAGEGAGYAGGIVSAAIDGQRCAEKCIAVLSKQK